MLTKTSAAPLSLVCIKDILRSNIQEIEQILLQFAPDKVISVKSRDRSSEHKKIEVSHKFCNSHFIYMPH